MKVFIGLFARRGKRGKLSWEVRERAIGYVRMVGTEGREMAGDEKWMGNEWWQKV